MNRLEKIAKAERRIMELQLLIKYWRLDQKKSESCINHIIEEINNNKDRIAA